MDKRLKIAIFIDTYFPMIDGVAMVVDNYAKRLQKYADVTVFCPVVDKHFKDEYNYKVVRCKSFKPSFLDYVAPMPRFDSKFMKHLKKERFDIVHIHSPFAVSSMGVRVAKRKNIPVVATLHSQYKQDLKKNIKLNWLTDLVLANLMKTFNSCDECWTVNEGIRRLYVNEYGLRVKNKVKNNASDLLPIEDRALARQEIRQRFEVSDDQKLFLFVGRINFIKNIPFIIKALSCLKQQNFRFKMIFVGNGSDTNALNKMIRDYHLEDAVILAGEIRDRNELEKIYSASDLFLFPSLYDANSLVQIEAASQALPTLFIREARTASSCVENQNAFMSDNDYVKYAQKIMSIFENQDLYQKVSFNAQKELYITWDDSIKSLIEDYERIIEEHHYNNHIT